MVSGPNGGLNVPPVGRAMRMVSAKVGLEGAGAAVLWLGNGPMVGVTVGVEAHAFATQRDDRQRSQ